MNRTAACLLLACLLWAAPALAATGESSPADLFQQAYALESQGKTDLALALYEKVAAGTPEDVYAGEALFRMAAIADEKLLLPARALPLYRRYLSQYHGRQTRRAEARVEYLSTFEKAKPEAYRAFVAILGGMDKDNTAPTIRDMRAFIAQNPDFPGLDEALLFLGSQLRGAKRQAKEKAELEGVAQAMEVFERVIHDYPGTRSAVIAWKNLGDCHLMRGEFSEAKKCYAHVMEEGGDFGRRLVGQYATLLSVENRREIIFRGVKVAFPLLAGALFFLVPLDWRILAAGLKKGLVACAFFLPAAAVLTGVTWALTEPQRSNIAGTEPLLVAILMAVTAVGLLLAAVGVEAGRRKRIRAAPFSVALVGLAFCAVYAAYHFLDLLPYVERLFL